MDGDRGRVEPLSRETEGGVRYARRPAVEKELADLVTLPRDQIREALRLRDRHSPRYISSEAIVHLIRRTRYDNSDRYFEALYKELLRRIQAALPGPISRETGTPIDLHQANARDKVTYEFDRKLLADRQVPGTDLDYFEVMFNSAIAALRATALRSARRERARSTPLEVDPLTNEPSLEVEQAVGSLYVSRELLSEDPIYRSRVAAAIDALPEAQRRVVEMLLRDMPMDSADENVPSIRRVLGVAEKTVRNRRDAAYRAIRAMLEMDQGDD